MNHSYANSGQDWEDAVLSSTARAHRLGEETDNLAEGKQDATAVRRARFRRSRERRRLTPISLPTELKRDWGGTERGILKTHIPGGRSLQGLGCFSERQQLIICSLMSHGIVPVSAI